MVLNCSLRTVATESRLNRDFNNRSILVRVLRSPDSPIMKDTGGQAGTRRENVIQAEGNANTKRAKVVLRPRTAFRTSRGGQIPWKVDYRSREHRTESPWLARLQSPFDGAVYCWFCSPNLEAIPFPFRSSTFVLNTSNRVQWQAPARF